MSWHQGKQESRNRFPNINQEILDREGYLEEGESKILLYKFLRQNPSFASELLTGVKLFPFQHMAVKAMMETDYFLGIWCLDQNEYILTEKGFKKIKDVNVGDYVRSRDSLNLVTDKAHNSEEDGLEIRLKSGESFKAKLGHKTLVYDNHQFLFKNIEELTIDDVVPVKLGMDVWGNRDVTANSALIRSPYLFYFLGYVLGDGHVTHQAVHYCSENGEIHTMIKAFLEENDLKVSAYQRSQNLHYYEYAIFNRVLVKWLESVGWDKSLKSKDKIIPDILLEASKNELCALIGGLFDADGYASIAGKARRVGLKSTSLQLLRQIKMLLNNLGVESHLRKTGQNKDVPYYDLILANDYESLVKFREAIDFCVIHKRDNLEFIIEHAKKRHYQNRLVPDLGNLLKEKTSYKKVTNQRGSWNKSFSQNKFVNLKELPEDLREIIDDIENESVIFSKIASIEPCKTMSVDITVENEENYIGNGIVHHNSRGMSKSFSTAIFAILDAVLNQGVHIGIISKSFRQAKMIFKKMEEISRSPKATFLAQCVTRISKQNDEWVMEIGRSKITALPLGDGEKLRGFRFQRMIIDELLLMPEKILNEVIMPFLSVVENPTERQEIHDLETKMIAEGKMLPSERIKWPNNKIIGLSSASYKFEYLYKMYCQYESLIMNENDQDGAHRVIMHFSYDCAPEQLYDINLINQAKATMSQSQFEREFGAVFTDDSSGYFKVSKMAACTIPDGEGQSVEIVGSKKDEYILAFDPSWSESESSDDFAMLLIKIEPNSRKGIVVHSYAMSGTNLKNHIRYAAYLLTHFNIVAAVGDYNGGVQFVNSCNESEIFKSLNLKLDIIDGDLDNHQEYEKNIRDLKRQYDPKTRKFVFLRKPSSQWIRYANESLQAAFDHKRIFFAGAAMDDDYHRQKKAQIPIKELNFLRNYEKDNDDGAKTIDFLEHQKDMMDLIKVQCALIQVNSSTQGTQSFDLPYNLKKQRGADKARKDSYSALVLGNWMLQVYFDMANSTEAAEVTTFTPMFIC
jgi:intein/homing endonuclease